MPDERENLASVRYWRTPVERVPQRFYVAFCLLMSSVHDCILGQKERESNNLNWSATFSYYSLVHGGRLLTFLALGDFPTSHAELRRLFSPRLGPRPNRRAGQDGYPFDWLHGFATLARRPQRQAPTDEAGTAGTAAEFRDMIAAYLNHVQVQEVEPRLTRFGNILAAAAPLRNDSNYESLLIAHEYRHVTMSNAFDRLSLHMGRAADTTLPFLVDAFTGFRRHDSDLPDARDEYEAFLHEYVDNRIGGAIRQKLGDSTTGSARLQDIIARLETRSTGARYDHLENQVSMAVFGGKSQLMSSFEQKIADLERKTR